MSMLPLTPDIEHDRETTETEFRPNIETYKYRTIFQIRLLFNQCAHPADCNFPSQQVATDKLVVYKSCCADTARSDASDSQEKVHVP